MLANITQIFKDIPIEHSLPCLNHWLEDHLNTFQVPLEVL